MTTYEFRYDGSEQWFRAEPGMTPEEVARHAWRLHCGRLVGSSLSIRVRGDGGMVASSRMRGGPSAVEIRVAPEATP